MHRRFVRWFLAFVLALCGVVFGLPLLAGAQLGGPAGNGKPSPKPWDPATLAPPPDAVATRDLPLVDDGPGGGTSEPKNALPFESANPVGGGGGGEKMPNFASPGLKPRSKPKGGVRDVDSGKGSADGLFVLEDPKDAKNSKIRGYFILVFTQYVEMGRLLQRQASAQLGLDVPFLHGCPKHGATP